MRPSPYPIVSLCVPLFLAVAVGVGAASLAGEERKPNPMVQAWEDLADSSPTVVLRALLFFADHPEETESFLEKLLLTPDARQLDAWIAKLDAPQFEEREQAEERLSQVAELAVEHLQRALDARPPLEVHHRLTSLLDSQGQDPGYRSRVRAVRAIAVLEHLDTPKARRIIDKVGGDGRKANSVLPAFPPSADETDAESPRSPVDLEPIWIRASAWSRSETRFFAAARARKRRAEKDTFDDSDFLRDFMTNDTGPAARAFLHFSRPKAAPLAARQQTADAFLRVAEALQSPRLSPNTPARPFVCPWSEWLPIVRPPGEGESDFRQAVRSAVAVLQESHRQVPLQPFVFQVPAEEKVDRDEEIERWQREAALSQHRLFQARETLEAAQAEGKDEPAFWQAAAAALTYHLMVRERFLEVYNYSLAQVRRSDLPELDPEVANGWRLLAGTSVVPHLRPSDQEVRKAYQTLAQQHSDSLWEALAWKELKQPPGLVWAADFEKSKPPQRAKGRTREQPAEDCPP